jgi:hypothetical protein
MVSIASVSINQTLSTPASNTVISDTTQSTTATGSSTADSGKVTAGDAPASSGSSSSSRGESRGRPVADRIHLKFIADR